MGQTGKTAHEVLAPTVNSSVEEDNAQVAADNGVTDAAYVEYAGALESYQERSDVETLDARRAREAGSDFSAAAAVHSTESAAPGVVSSASVRGKRKK